MNTNKTVFVTGAAGFIGGWVVEMLSLNGCERVRAGVRSWSGGARVARFPVEIALCDIMEESQAERAVKGANWVVHCAKTDDAKVIIEGTHNMLKAAYRQGVEKFIYLSSAEVYGTLDGELDETNPLTHAESDYAVSKREAEKLCWDYHRKGLPVTILRPSIVYGPFSDWWTARFAQRLCSGNWGIFKGYGEGYCNLIYVCDLVTAILLAAGNEKAVGHAFNVNGPELITWNEYFQRFNTELKLPPLEEIQPSRLRVRSSFMGPIRLAGNFALEHFREQIMTLYQGFESLKKIMRNTQEAVRTTPTYPELSLYNRKAFYKDTKAREILGYNPRFNLNNGLRLSVSWLYHFGYLSHLPDTFSEPN